MTLVLLAVGASFLVSASVGLGGSLLMVPTLVLALGAREGVALAALLLACNNILKVVAYRKSIPWRSAFVVVALLSVGTLVGALALVHAPEPVIVVAVIGTFLATLAIERFGWDMGRLTFGRVLAFASGATSGFSGTSGPLKGMAIRNLGLDRRHFVGAASIASLAGDLTKTAVYAQAQLLGPNALIIAAAVIPLMVLATLTGFRLNRRVGERGFALLFWGVMAGYSVRLIFGVV